MNSQPNRRFFIRSGTIAGCSLLIAGKLSAFSFPPEEIPDPKKLNYCGYTCPKDCHFLEATLKNSEELKRKAYEEWHIKERYNVDFDPETTFCYGCKNKEKPAGVAMQNCTVRSCAIEKKYDSCIQCDELTACKKDLWSRFPDFYKSVIKMQGVYLENKG